MSDSRSAFEGSSRKNRRDDAREKARELREQERRRRVRRRVLLQGGIGVAIIVVVVIVVVVVTASVRHTQQTAVGPRNMASDGILLTGANGAISAVTTPGLAAGQTPTPTSTSSHPDTVNVVTYIDYQCPICQQFEAANGTLLQQLVTSGAITLEVHPLAFLDAKSLGNRYSTRAANAAACVAQYDPDDFLAFTAAMYEHQPAENTSGESDDALKKVVSDAGVTSSDVASCISDETFAAWTSAATARVTASGATIPNSDVTEFPGTPLVVIDGHAYTGGVGDTAALQKAILAASAAKGVGATSSPSPSATP